MSSVCFVILCNAFDFLFVQLYIMSANMEKFNLNIFPGVALAPKKRKRVLLKYGHSVIELGVKEKAFDGTASDASSSGGAQSSTMQSLVLVPLRVGQLKKSPQRNN